MTYQELYIQHLENKLDEGGAQEDVEKAIAEFNTPTRDGFDVWIKALPWVACTTCGDSFKPEEPYPVPSQEILCQTHSPKLAMTPP